MKTLIIGSEGQLGRDFMKLYPDSIGTSHVPSKESYLPMEDEDAIIKFLTSEEPDVIINCAALTNVDRCEKEKEYAYRVNGLAVRSMAMKCREIEAKLVHISTDYVFDGTDGNYLENAPPNPVNYYGLSKLAGEQFAYSVKGNLVIRASGVFGYSNNFLAFSMLRDESNGLLAWSSATWSDSLTRFLSRLKYSAIFKANSILETRSPATFTIPSSFSSISLLTADASSLA